MRQYIDVMLRQTKLRTPESNAYSGKEVIYAMEESPTNLDLQQKLSPNPEVPKRREVKAAEKLQAKQQP